MTTTSQHNCSSSSNNNSGRRSFKNANTPATGFFNQQSPCARASTCIVVDDHQEHEVLVAKDCSGQRERLKRHREEVAGRVRVPEKWSQEKLLREWMDYSSFNALLAPNGVALARQALMSEGGCARGSQRMRIEGRC